MKIKFFTKKKIIIFSVLAVIIAAGWVVFANQGKNKTSYVTDTAQRKNLLQTVSEVGTVESPSQIDLNFSSPGKLAAKFAAIGDQIKTGQVLAQLDSQSLMIARDQAQSNLVSAQASLTKLLQGASASQLAVAQAQVDQANAAYSAAVDSLNKTKLTVAQAISQAQNTLNDLQDTTSQANPTNKRGIALSTIDDELAQDRTALDVENKILTDDNLKAVLGALNSILVSGAKNDYARAMALLGSAQTSLDNAKLYRSDANVDQAVNDAINSLNGAQISLNSCFDVLQNTVSGKDVTQTQIDGYKTSISGQLSAINAGVTAIQSASQAFKDAVVAADNALATAKVSGNQEISAAGNSADTASQTLAVAQKQLAQLKAPPRTEDINLAQAQVNNARSALDLASQQIDNAMIKSPIDGQVIKDNYAVGEQTNLATPVFSVLAQNDLEISVDISESDIVKVKQDDAVEITLDAFGPDQKFNGIVYFIDPASTVIQDVTYYRVKIKFTDPAGQLAQIKPGMTANVTIIADKRTDVLTVPERAIIAKTDGDKIVRILENGKITEAPVKIGLRGDDGSVEITAGNLLQGQTVVVFINTK
ncbi:MAG: efflux RND transporter periplasmic adaptor subunit [Patescibacteria group bacterium]|nr:efflux RND transporter periplasmic adaptor subunit [Patescibacteria group bacterium]